MVFGYLGGTADLDSLGIEGMDAAFATARLSFGGVGKHDISEKFGRLLVDVIGATPLLDGASRKNDLPTKKILVDNGNEVYDLVRLQPLPLRPYCLLSSKVVEFFAVPFEHAVLARNCLKLRGLHSPDRPMVDVAVNQKYL